MEVIISGNIPYWMRSIYKGKTVKAESSDGYCILWPNKSKSFIFENKALKE